MNVRFDNFRFGDGCVYYKAKINKANINKAKIL